MEQFANIPHEMREYKQWILWRYEFAPPMKKPTKTPYVGKPNGKKASVTNPNDWVSFDDILLAPFTCIEPVHPDEPVTTTGYSGIGFVFSKDDPFTGIDLDDTNGDIEAGHAQIRIFNEFNSYSELSPSGQGLHIIVKGKLPQGRRRSFVEIYSSERYFTMTGNTYHNVPIAERQDLLNILFEQMGGPAITYQIDINSPQKEDDDAIISKAALAVNGEKFQRLWLGHWQGLYASQSEADFALIDILGFYTQNEEQVIRLFRSSGLGQRDKAYRDDYCHYMFLKAMDRQLPPVDIEGLKIQFENMKSGADATGLAKELQSKPVASPPTETQGRLQSAVPVVLPQGAEAVNVFPPGLLGQIAQYFYDASPRPVKDISLATAIALLSGITGRAYNISGQGLNQYILLLAPTGTGKDIVSNGISRLMSEVQVSVPSAIDFRGPGELVSAAGLIKWLNDRPTTLSVLGEIGILLQQMAAPNASAHLKGLERILLQLYSKSGQGNALDPTAYSDTMKNTKMVISPSLTVIGESVPETFYEILDDRMIASGLLPRFMVFEYKGKREYLKEGTENVKPSFDLVQSLADLASQCLSLSHNNQVNNVATDEEAKVKLREYEIWTTDKINETKSENIRQLWNRAHLKVLKLAAVCAVGINPFHPIVTINETMWAINIINFQINKLIVRYETGNIGMTAGSESRQLQEITKVISSFLKEPYDRYKKYGGTQEMHFQGVITESHISRRCLALAAFRNDRQGPTVAVKRTLKMMLEADEIREIPQAQMQATFGSKPKAYVVSNPARFMAREED